MTKKVAITNLKTLDKNSIGLIPVVVQNAESNEVLMVGFADFEALEKTLKTSLATFYSRSRNEIWVKGETSGNFLEVVEIMTDCDNDAVIYRAIPKGPTCHTGKASCFYNSLELE